MDPVSLFNSVEAVLIDFDGVLTDSEPYYYKACLEAFSKMKLVNPPVFDVYVDIWVNAGNGISEYSKINQTGFKTEDFQEFELQRKSVYEKFALSGEIKLIPGVLEIVDLLIARNLKTTIASNSKENVISSIIRKSPVKFNKKCGLIGRRPGLRKKPDPDIFIYAAGFLGVDPVNCLVIEDAQKGITAAKIAGMKTIAVRTEINRNFEYDTDFIAEEGILQLIDILK